MLEIEAKARVRDRVALVEGIEAQGAIPQGTRIQRDVYYAHPDRDFSQTDEALRVRETGGEYRLTYKGPKLDQVTKTREELEVKIEDLDKMIGILTRLGFTEVGRVEKQRTSYTLGDYRVMVDDVVGLGCYIEVEKKAEDYEPQELIDLLAKLGVDREDVERRSYLELILDK